MTPTMQLRFVERPEPVSGTGMVSTVRKIRVLQQYWESQYMDKATGKPVTGEWRDVPLVTPDTANEKP